MGRLKGSKNKKTGNDTESLADFNSLKPRMGRRKRAQLDFTDLTFTGLIVDLKIQRDRMNNLIERAEKVMDYQEKLMVLGRA